MVVPYGYYHPDYARSLEAFGEPVELKRCGGYILKRTIPGFQFCDAMGCYPLFCCNDWKLLCADISQLKQEVIALGLVTDPFAGIEPQELEKCFEIIFPFKNHYIIDLTRNWEQRIDRRHKQKISKALEIQSIEICDQPLKYLEEWTELYGVLIQRHNIFGIKAFSKECFKKQLGIPGMILIVGKVGREIAGANLIIIDGKYAYDHLAAYSLKGYEISASYGILWATFQYLAKRGIHYCDLGGASGVKPNARDGLDQFKRGWTKDTLVSYFCGQVFDSAIYERICREMGICGCNYFPAYRTGEF